MTQAFIMRHQGVDSQEVKRAIHQSLPVHKVELLAWQGDSCVLRVESKRGVSTEQLTESLFDLAEEVSETDASFYCEQ